MFRLFVFIGNFFNFLTDYNILNSPFDSQGIKVNEWTKLPNFKWNENVLGFNFFLVNIVNIYE